MKELTTSIIDLEKLKRNINNLNALTSDKTEIMGVVKADAYGHGAVKVAKTAVESGCKTLAVARFSELKELVDNNITQPILLFGYCDSTYVDFMINSNSIASVGSVNSAKEISKTAHSIGKKLKTHIKIDTGMGRIGGSTDINSIVDDIIQIHKLNGLEIQGLYTHFATADSLNKDYAMEQFSKYMDVVTKLESHGIYFKCKHCANSAATIELPETHLDMVRPGISLYGMYPSSEVDKSLVDLEPVMSVKSTIIQIKDVPAGFKVSYGSTYVTNKPSKIAVVPIGYADGYSRLLSSRGSMIVNGYKVPIIGRVCMDLTMIDISNIQGVSVGDSVTVIGNDGINTISADDIAELTGTINYEVTTTITKRVPRIYI